MAKEKKKSDWSKIKYKTYNAKEGFGNSESWKKSFHNRMSKETVATPKHKYFSDCETLQELKSQYKKLIKKHHPDIVGDTKENKETTQEIIKEYNEIKDNITKL